MIFVPTGSLVGTFFVSCLSNEQGISLANDIAICPFFFRRYSIVTPSQVHRFDGVTMEIRWTSDGETKEE